MGAQINDLQQRAEAARADANVAKAEAAKFADALRALVDAANKAEEAATKAAEEVAYELQYREASEAEARADGLLNVASKAAVAAAEAMDHAQAMARGAAQARTVAEAAVSEAKRLTSNLKPIGNYARVDGVGFVEVVAPFGPRDPKLICTDGRLLDHVYEHENGDWVYRVRSSHS